MSATDPRAGRIPYFFARCLICHDELAIARQLFPFCRACEQLPDPEGRARLERKAGYDAWKIGTSRVTQ